jgi:adenosine tuberculosinyltransferase
VTLFFSLLSTLTEKEMIPQTNSLQAFLELSSEQIAQIVRSYGSKTCVFPFNGTRRWFLLEHEEVLDQYKDPNEAYSDIAGSRYLEMYDLVFKHGLDTLLVPTFGGETVLNRGEEYMQSVGIGLSRLATHPDFVSFYQEHQVRVRFYGDYRAKLGGTPYAYIVDLFDQITAETQHNNKYRLFYGVFADDYIEPIAKLTIEYFKKTGRPPTKRELIEAYYGEYIEKVDIFIGYEKFTVYDYPLLAWGGESLYFTVAPSLYITKSQLRKLLYDYLYISPVYEIDYLTMPPDDFETMRNFYAINRDAIFGIGEMRNGIWYPKSGVKE